MRHWNPTDEELETRELADLGVYTQREIAALLTERHSKPITRGAVAFRLHSLRRKRGEAGRYFRPRRAAQLSACGTNF